MHELILFDYDGTLVHSLPSIHHATRRTFEEKGLPLPDQSAVNAALADGRGVEFFFAILVPELPEEEIPEWVRLWRALYDAEAEPHTHPYPGALETLEALKRAGRTLAVVSNKGQPALERSVAAHGFASLVDLVVGDSPGQPKKPKAEMFHQRVAPPLASALPGLDPARVVMVGDSESDLRFGRALGGFSCFAAYGYGQRESCMAQEPHMVIEDIRSLPETLNAASGA